MEMECTFDHYNDLVMVSSKCMGYYFLFNVLPTIEITVKLLI